jgi:hypothetical protein
VESATKKLAGKIPEWALAALRGKWQNDDLWFWQLRNRLELLEEMFVIPALNLKPQVFLWPRDKDLRDLDRCIFGLAHTLRKKKLLTHTEAIALVDRKWPRLHLLRRILQLIKAGLGHPMPPAPPKSVEHFLSIKSLVNGRGRKADLARRFIRDHELLRSKRRKLSEISWADYEEILLRRDGERIVPQCPIPFISTKTSCCVRYLEMERDFWLWSLELEELKQQREVFGDSTPFDEWLERNDLRDSGLDATRLERRREAARKRQARRRQKILAKKRDRFASDASRRKVTSKDLRDIRPP